MKLEEARVGLKVLFSPYSNCSDRIKEKGIITSFSDKYIYVKYDNNLFSKLTHPKTLEVSYFQ